MHIEHKNFGWLHAPPLPPACCHGLWIRSESKVVLIESGIGRDDIAKPSERIGEQAIEAAGFQFLPEVTAAHQLEQHGISTDQVTDIVLTHCDPDHAGGLSDFPQAKVHVSAEELENVSSGNPRYGAAQFTHDVHWVPYEQNDSQLFDLDTRQVHTSLNLDLRLVPLPGHTLGHCGIAVPDGPKWKLHAGDAYYLRAELTDKDHPINQLATFAADDNAKRLRSLDHLRRLAADFGDELEMFGYHDIDELPDEIPQLSELLQA